MAAIGECFVVPDNRLGVVAEAIRPRKRLFGGSADRFHEVLGRESLNQHIYDGSGYVLATLLPYLDQRGIALMRSRHDDVANEVVQARRTTCFVLTSDHRDQYLTDLDPSRFDADDLRRYYEEFTQTETADAGGAMLAGVAFFRDVLTDLGPDRVGVLLIG